jgi:hypothetical protein
MALLKARKEIICFDPEDGPREDLKIFNYQGYFKG